MNCKLLFGNKHVDHRGIIRFNNSFDMSLVKRIYIIENIDQVTTRRWQGHKIEQRWFSAVQGSFKIQLIKIDDWENPSKNLDIQDFLINSEKLDILHIPEGYVTSIQSTDSESRLLVMADYNLGEINDEYRFPVDYFENN